ncbi:hypothetical protein [Hankyongella ginsenosidimutans]|uniref:hypothetical protein n=1 Tax=Hankyongella ginsenosidimutans TaxID=1763828 RepID=UPI001FE3BED3|nr:hypothetical protein [Hankyongella ginsenosidimutans]
MRADIGGVVGDPDVSGQFRARGARYENLNLGAKVTDFTMRGNFTGPTIKIEQAQGKVGKRGRSLSRARRPCHPRAAGRRQSVSRLMTRR